MKTTLKTAPVKMPVTMQEVKEHLRVTLGRTDEDAYLEGLRSMAVTNVEQIMRRKLITQSWYYYPVSWPDKPFLPSIEKGANKQSNKMPIPYGKLQSITSIKYTNSSEVEATFSAADYYLTDTNSDLGKAVLRYGESWPSVTLSPSDPIEVEYICGYGLTGAAVPAPIIHAIKLFVATMYENRETVIVGPGMVAARPLNLESLLNPYILHEVFI